MDPYEKPHPPQAADKAIEKLIEHRHLICRGLACLVLPFVRYGGGREVEGRAVALAMLVGWAFFTHDIFCLLYLAAWIVGMLIYAGTTRRDSHSQWEGWPYLMYLIPSYRAANFLEIFAVGGAGLVMPPFLGMVFLASAAGMWINFVTDWWQQRKDVIAYRDSNIVMRNRRDAYRR